MGSCCAHVPLLIRGSHDRLERGNEQRFLHATVSPVYLALTVLNCCSDHAFNSLARPTDPASLNGRQVASIGKPCGGNMHAGYNHVKKLRYG